jgi:hypothetical protein
MSPRAVEEAAVAALLAPIVPEEFRSQFWMTRHLLCRGPADRFADLLPWPAFNRILERHCRDVARFRLAREGRDLEPREYLDSPATTPRIRAEAVLGHLRRGATLALHAVDEVHAPLGELAESFEAFFEADTQINVYASWRALHGLDVHRDEEDVFVLQVHGRKRWLLYGVDIERGAPGPLAAGAVLDTTLTAGDVLYVPRGCFHLAVPLNEATLHLTVGIAGPVRPRPTFSLPWSATPEGLPAGRAFAVRLAGTAPLTIDAAPGIKSLTLVSAGRTYRFPDAMRLVAARLQPLRPIPMKRLLDVLADDIDEDGLRLLLAMLVKHALVEIVC